MRLWDRCSRNAEILRGWTLALIWTAFTKKEPAIRDGCQSREETLPDVGNPLNNPNHWTDGRSKRFNDLSAGWTGSKKQFWHQRNHFQERTKSA